MQAAVLNAACPACLLGIYGAYCFGKSIKRGFASLSM
jgi:hypothetical protein